MASTWHHSGSVAMHLSSIAIGPGRRCNADGRSAGANAAEILRVDPIVGREIALEVSQEDRHIDQSFPAGARLFEDDAHVLEHRTAL